MTPMQTEGLLLRLDRFVKAHERLADATETIAAILKDETKCGGALDGVGNIASAVEKLALEVSGVAQEVANDPRRV